MSHVPKAEILEIDFSKAEQLKGVEKVVSGYSGGNVPGHPTYREICSGLTGHAEVVQIAFDANVISYEDILVNPKEVLLGVCDFLEVTFEEHQAQISSNPPPAPAMPGGSPATGGGGGPSSLNAN